MRIFKILVDFAEKPIGIDIQNPKFTWILSDSKRGAVQAAYRITVASSVKALKSGIIDMWDTGKVISSETAHIEYKGKSLESCKNYFVSLQVWASEEDENVFEANTFFGTALLNKKEWMAKWIGEKYSKVIRYNVYGDDERNQYLSEVKSKLQIEERSRILLKTVPIEAIPSSAKVFICGLGSYVLRINGKKVGDQVLGPVRTEYDKRIYYDTYEAADYLKKGINVLEIELGNGWYNPKEKYCDWRMQPYGDTRALMQMHLLYNNGEKQLFLTDETWKAAKGPIISSCIYDGEVYDANLELPHGKELIQWMETLPNAVITEAPTNNIRSSSAPPNKITEVIENVKLIRQDDNSSTYDLGQNFAGWIRVKVSGSKGIKLKIRHAEEVDAENRLNVKNNYSVESTDVYILKGSEEETYEPRFTYHGFRFIELSGEPQLPQILSVKGCVVHSSVHKAGEFTCSNELINRIQHCILWSQRSNLQQGVPIDCPQRGERLGWLADAHVTAEEAMHNFNMLTFYRKWLEDMKTGQNPENGNIPHISPWACGGKDHAPDWSSAYILIPWYIYKHYGDKSILESHYENMKKFMNYLENTSENYISPKSRYGDWLSAVEGWVRGDPELTNTGFYYYCATIMVSIADELNKPEDAAGFSILSKKIKKAFNNKYFNPSACIYGDGSQFANAFPLFLDIVPNGYKEKVLNNLINDIEKQNQGHLTTGIFGTKYMPEVLSEMGRADVAYSLVTKEGYPGWEYMIQNKTTLCEKWSGTVSHNHIMFGSIGAWFYRTLAGININESSSGKQKILFKPFMPEDMDHVKAWTETIRGIVGAEWRKESNTLTYKVEIPVGCIGEIWLEINEEKSMIIRESGAILWHDRYIKGVSGVSKVEIKDCHIVISCTSGVYNFTMTEESVK